MNVGSLFSGIGGIELGFEREGFHTLWFIEKDRYAQGVIRKHWRDAIIYDDITEVDFRTLPKVDVLTGGFPCQDISIAGKGAGIQGKRSSLWKYYKEAIRVLRPKYAFIENVSRLLNNGFETVLGDLSEVGYDAEWHCLPATIVGCPFKGERVYIIATTRSNTNGLFIDREYEVYYNKEWESTKNIKSWSEWKCWLVQACETMDGAVSKTDFHRVDDGFSEDVDRIRCLGNAVVPQVAQLFAKAIKEREKTFRFKIR